MRTHLLSLENLSIHLNGFKGDTKKLVSNININIDRGEFVALIGESGSGKSLSALSTVGLLPSAIKASGTGKWLNLNYDLADYNSLKMFRGKEIGFIFQEPLVSLNPLLCPAIENGWHGKPADKTSKSGISLASVFVISFSGLS